MRPSTRLRPRTPQAMLIHAIGILILVGTLLLWLPWSHVPGRVTFLDAFFTATSAVCVTGLVVVDTGSAYTPFGQAVIVLLIQAGGLGVMTFAALAFQILGRRMSLSAQAAVQDSVLAESPTRSTWKLLRQVLQLTLIAEGVGAVLMFLALIPGMPPLRAAGSAVFHSVSAFCNAGFSIFSNNLEGQRGNVLFLSTVVVLIVLGGLGHVTILELRSRVRHRHTKKSKSPRKIRMSLHARVVLRMSAVLVVAGFLGLLILGGTAPDAGVIGASGDALFQSVTARTAGFNTIPIGSMPAAALFLLMLLMFVGGSPASCAGGIKTTTAAIWFAHLRAGVLGRRDVHLLGHRIPEDLLVRATRLIGLAVIWNGLGVLLLLSTSIRAGDMTLQDAAFEQISAFGTVGLSTGVTEHLNPVARLWIILTMFVGRVGPLTVVLWARPGGRSGVRAPEERVLIG